MSLPSNRFVLRNLPLAARVLLAAFLISVGVGYFFALVQLHFQHASAGQLLPGSQEVIQVYSGYKDMSELVHLLTAGENRPFNGSGTMQPAFTTKSSGWKGAIRREAKKYKLNDLQQAEKQLRLARDAERQAVLAWLHAGAKKEDYGKFRLPEQFDKEAIDDPDGKFFPLDADGQQKKDTANIEAIVETRCVRCHSEGAAGPAGNIPLDTWEDIQDYCQPSGGSGLSMTKLAQTTHVHLLGFSMLYGLTGLIFALTSYPCWIRLAIAPLPLVAQVADISCWWLSRVDPLYAQVILVTGGLVAVGLAIQILGSLFSLFGKKGNVVLLLFLAGGLVLSYEIKKVFVDPHLLSEKNRVASEK